MLPDRKNAIRKQAIRFLAIGLTTAALGACVTVPAPLQGQFAPTTPRDAGTSDGQLVRWGGEIIGVDPHADQTCFEILARELDGAARPYSRDPSNGRFIACRNGFYDPEEFKRGRDITIVGHLSGTEQRKVGEFDYTYPRVAADTVYLWPERPLYVASPYYYDPWGPWWGYGPYWGSYWGGPTYIIRHTAPAPAPRPSSPPPP